MRVIRLVSGFLLFLLFAGCNGKTNDTNDVVVAECYGNRLYLKDLADVVPVGTDASDSIIRVNAYIDSWVTRHLLLHEAEKNLSPEDLDFKKQIEDYRNSLAVYAFETQWVDQHLDTVVTDEQIKSYYDEHKANFQLRHTMVKAAYVVLKNDCKQKSEIRKLMSAKGPLSHKVLDPMASLYAVSFYLDDSTWIRLDALQEAIPIEFYNAQSYLKKNKFVSFEKKRLTYMVRFNDYLMEESVSPLEFEYDNIKSVILMQRKNSLLKALNTQLYEKAAEDHAFTIYVGSSATDVDN